MRGALALVASVAVVATSGGGSAIGASVTGDRQQIDAARVLALPELPNLRVVDQEVWDGDHKFFAKGVVFEGFQLPYVTQTDCLGSNGQKLTEEAARVCNRHVLAQDYYFGRGQFEGRSALDLAISQWNVNTVRLNVNLAALDPNSAFHRDLNAAAVSRPGVRPYIDEIESAVNAASERNLAVIITVFSGENIEQGNIYWAPPRGAAEPVNLSALRPLGDSTKDRHDFNSYNPGREVPDASTKRALAALAEQFRNNSNVVLESLNEPGAMGDLDPTQSAMSQYLNGGGRPATGSEGSGLGPAVGIRDIVRTLREDHNYTRPFIVPSLGSTMNNQDLAGAEQYAPGKVDRQLIYAVHPFPKKGNVDWDVRFGNFSRSHPVILTAWQVDKNDFADRDGDQDAPQKFVYAIKQGYNGGSPATSNGTNIGVMGFAFDVAGSITRSFGRENFTLASPDPAAPNDTPVGCDPTAPSETPVGCNRYGGGGGLLQNLFNQYRTNGTAK